MTILRRLGSCPCVSHHLHCSFLPSVYVHTRTHTHGCTTCAYSPAYKLMKPAIPRPRTRIPCIKADLCSKSRVQCRGPVTLLDAGYISHGHQRQYWLTHAHALKVTVATTFTGRTNHQFKAYVSVIFKDKYPFLTSKSQVSLSTNVHDSFLLFFFLPILHCFSNLLKHR